MHKPCRIVGPLSYFSRRSILAAFVGVNRTLRSPLDILSEFDSHIPRQATRFPPLPFPLHQHHLPVPVPVPAVCLR